MTILLVMYVIVVCKQIQLAGKPLQLAGHRIIICIVLFFTWLAKCTANDVVLMESIESIGEYNVY